MDEKMINRKTHEERKQAISERCIIFNDSRWPDRMFVVLGMTLSIDNSERKIQS